MDRRAALLALAAPALLLACAQAPRRFPADRTAFWSGRLALRVEGEDRQSFAAGFELSGAAEQGALKLLSPFGSTIAQIEWSADGALLRVDRQQRRFASLDQLLQESTGGPLPVRALFDWLAGTDTPLAGWTTELDALAQGRLTARRLEPAPIVHLRVLLDLDGKGDGAPRTAP